MDFSDAEIKVINEVFHDIEADAYDCSHDEIFVGEKKTAQDIFSRFFAGAAKQVILDIGSGTGFVPSTLNACRPTGSALICGDISLQMLKKSREKQVKGFSTGISFVKLDADYLPFASRSFDAIILFSVLHHLPDYGRSLQEASRVLKEGGRLFILHEPNKRFSQNGLLVAFSRLVGYARGLAAELRPRQGKKGRSIYDRFRAAIQTRLSLPKTLTDAEIQALVDIHSPTAAGKLDKGRGFLVENLVSGLNNECIVEYQLTKNFFCKADDSQGLLRLFASLFSLLFPADGYIMHLVLKKQNRVAGVGK
ncbi:MAG TPA: class I SAM-dependent methyltransferase [Candidatus Diapherotrites archaeon]|uniref:Class I SAM-dependent methyltransferase n=1 Tax=Candidatus Iainarchaeum sp. TaxID=3101447 RepID=A0A7J4JGU4_9ARCH|nr:class I SAM-dependent methyltransferase [Candidatus Diapherotrites archaeon]